MEQNIEAAIVAAWTESRLLWIYNQPDWSAQRLIMFLALRQGTRVSRKALQEALGDHGSDPDNLQALKAALANLTTRAKRDIPGIVESWPWRDPYGEPKYVWPFVRENNPTTYAMPADIAEKVKRIVPAGAFASSRQRFAERQHIDDEFETAARLQIEALHTEEAHEEGALSHALVNRYERDPNLRAATLRRYGYRCQACSFSFEAAYGTRGRDFIEVHHLRPISNWGGQNHSVTTDDMTVLCANCHRMLHYSASDPLTLEQLRKLIRRRRIRRGPLLHPRNKGQR